MALIRYIMCIEHCLQTHILTDYGFDHETVTLVTGLNKQTFQVHPSHLENSSVYFKLALKKEWTEGQDNKVTLEDVDAGLLDRYLHFIYTGQVACEDVAANAVSAKTECCSAAKVEMGFRYSQRVTA